MVFDSLVEIMDREIHLYTNMKNLLIEKKNILVKNNISELQNVDKNLTYISKSIKEVESLRIKTIEEIDENISNLSDLIKITGDKSTKHKIYFEHIKEKLIQLSKEITSLNQTNIELIRHGIIMSDKKLNIIIEACSSKTNNYSKYGKEKNENITMSTIIKNA